MNTLDVELNKTGTTDVIGQISHQRDVTLGDSQKAYQKAYLRAKRVFDFCSSAVALVILSPVFLVISLCVKLEDGGSVIYRHHRVGQDGADIYIYKFRSMKEHADQLEKMLTPEQLEQYHREFKIDNDPRITKIGNILRKTSLDELPQLVNIMRGDLSVVGPRPILEDELNMYTAEEQKKFLSVKPGLTGYWQAYARNNATYESGVRQAMELYYVDHAGGWFDIKIILKTVVSVIKKSGAQ